MQAGTSGRDFGRAGQLAQPSLGGYLPDRRRAHQDLVFLVTDQCADPSRKASVAVEPPEKRVRVEHEPHLPLPALDLLRGERREESLGRLSATPHGTEPAPRLHLSHRHQAHDGRASSRDYTSSPAQARSISFDKCVFAACTVTGFMKMKLAKSG